MKDIFHGGIQRDYIGQAIFTTIFVAVLMLVGAVLFLCLALYDDAAEANTRILLLVMAGLCLIFAVGYPVATVYFARRHRRYPRIARLFLQDYLFTKKGIVYAKRKRTKR